MIGTPSKSTGKNPDGNDGMHDIYHHQHKQSSSILVQANNYFCYMFLSTLNPYFHEI